MTVLIIDDDAAYTYLVESALTGMVDTILTAKTWDDAMKQLDQKPDVAWVDLCIPPDTVQDSVKRLKELRYQNRELVIVISSGYIEPRVADQLGEIGIDAIMAKGGRFEAGQVAALVIVGMMRVTDRGLKPNREYLDKAMKLMHDRFPHVNIPQTA